MENVRVGQWDRVGHVGEYWVVHYRTPWIP